MRKKISAEALIKELRLAALPIEGGHFRQTYRDSELVSVTTPDLAGPIQKPRATAILYLLSDDPDSFSALHGLPTDEVYHSIWATRSSCCCSNRTAPARS